jgi:hypothetical protein
LKRQDLKLSSALDQLDLLFTEASEFTMIKPDSIKADEFGDPELRQLVWEKITKLLRTSLLLDPEKVRDYSKSL